MQKPQIATNRKQKASDATTPKASHLTVVSNSTKERPMNNSTVTQQNNQPQQSAWGLAYEAERVAKLVNKSAYAIKSIGSVLEFNLCNDDCDEDTLNKNVLGGLVTAIKLISDTLDDSGNDLGNTLVKGGFINE